MPDFFISTNPAWLDTEWMVAQIKHAPWGHWQGDEAIRTALAHSLVFGLYAPQRKMVGFARVVTDYGVFSSITDVIVAIELRGLGLGRKLMEEMLSDDRVGKTLCVLGDGGIPGFYAKFGFEHRGNVMVRKPNA